MPLDPRRNTAAVAAAPVLAECGGPGRGRARGIDLSIEKGLPLSSGLGSSAASAAAGAFAAGLLLGATRPEGPAPRRADGRARGRRLVARRQRLRVAPRRGRPRAVVRSGLRPRARFAARASATSPDPRAAGARTAHAPRARRSAEGDPDGRSHRSRGRARASRPRAFLRRSRGGGRVPSRGPARGSEAASARSRRPLRARRPSRRRRARRLPRGGRSFAPRLDRGIGRRRADGSSRGRSLEALGCHGPLSRPPARPPWSPARPAGPDESLRLA